MLSLRKVLETIAGQRTPRNEQRRTRRAFLERLEDRSLLASDLVSLATVTSSTAGGPSYAPEMSADGRYIVFDSFANNLVSDDTNSRKDIFVSDLQTGIVTRVNTDSAGRQANGDSYYSFHPVISADGRFVAFDSEASNLVSGDTNGQHDVFLKDLQTGATSRINANSDGELSAGGASGPAISADGRYVAFASLATDLVAGDTNGQSDVFLKDTQTGAISLVSTDVAGAQANSGSSDQAISADGRFVAFSSRASNLVSGDSNGFNDVFLKDMQTGAITRVNTSGSGGQANQELYSHNIRTNGRFVAFDSDASNLVTGDTNGKRDIFLKDTQTGSIALVSSNSAGQQGNGQSGQPAMSADGRYVAFWSDSSNLAPGAISGVHHVFLKDTQTGVTSLASADSVGEPAAGRSQDPAISADGRLVAFSTDADTLISGDTNGLADIFLKDMQTKETKLATPAVSGIPTSGNERSHNPAMSADGRYVAFQSQASNLVPDDTNGRPDIFLTDRETGAVSLVSISSTGEQAYRDSYPPAISADGRFVAFPTYSENLVPGDTNSSLDVFLRDTQLGITTRVSTNSAGEEGNSGSYQVAMSADGRFVAFTSRSSNLVDGDINELDDVFLKDLQSGVVILVSSGGDGVLANGSSAMPAISIDGRYVSFESSADNLVPGDSNGKLDIFLKDTLTGALTRVSTDSAGEESNNLSNDSSVSADGRFVAFRSLASNLVSGDTNGQSDIFLKDLQTGELTRISTDSYGRQGVAESSYARISSDGRFVAFATASNLVPSGTRGIPLVFVKETQTGAITMVSLDQYGEQGNFPAGQTAFSADGRFVGFFSIASNLSPFDGNQYTADVFVAENPFAGPSPLASNGSGTTAEDVSLLVDFRPLVFDGETADEDLTYVITKVTNGTAVSTDTTGIWEFTPDSNFNGSAAITYHVTDGDGLSSTPDNTFTITVNAVGDAASISGTSQGSAVEDVANVAGGTLTVSDDDANEGKFQTPASLKGSFGAFTFDTNSGEWTFTLDRTLVAVQALKAGETVNDVLSVTSFDGSASENIVITITGTNDAPILDNTLNPALAAAREDATNPAGTLVSLLLTGAVSDPDEGALRGIAIGTSSDYHGVWEYRLNNYVEWLPAGSVSESAALLLPGWSRLRFIPNADFNGTVKMYYRAWDQTQGSPGERLSLSGKTGGTNAFSSAYESAALVVLPVNDPPRLSLSGSVGYKRNASPITLAPFATVADVDSANLYSGQLRVWITDGANSSNRLVIGSGFTVDANNNVLQGSTIIGKRTSSGFGTSDLIVTFNYRVTPIIAQQLARAITFQTKDGPAGQRTILFTLSDGDGGLSDEAIKKVNVT